MTLNPAQGRRHERRSRSADDCSGGGEGRSLRSAINKSDMPVDVPEQQQAALPQALRASATPLHGQL